MMCDLAGLVDGPCGGEDDSFVSHIESAVSSRLSGGRGRAYHFRDPGVRSFMLTQIKFGTSGWRAVMAEEFTFANVQRAVGGIARYVSSQKSNRARVEVIVGRDPRFLGET